jgi:lysozyme
VTEPPAEAPPEAPAEAEPDSSFQVVTEPESPAQAEPDPEPASESQFQVVTEPEAPDEPEPESPFEVVTEPDLPAELEPDPASPDPASPDPASPEEPAAADVPIAKMQHGVDVAAFQGAPSGWRSEAGAIRWAAVKLTELEPGDIRYVNPDAASDWAYVKDQKLGRIAYLFAHPSVGTGDTVSFFLTELRKLGLTDTDGVMLDLEETDGLQPEQVSAWAVEVMASLARSLRRTPILYTYLSFAYSGNTAGLGGYPLWISDPSSPMGKPVVPSPWKRWAIHQYSTSGVIDKDIANFASVKAMEEAFGVPAAPPPKPQKGNLGGSVTGGVAAVRWGDGSILIAGLDHLDHVQIRRYDGGGKKWGVWWNPAGTTKAAGPPALLSWGGSYGQLYFATEGGAVMELGTEDTGRTWQVPSGA